jgi:hypothetical protein
MVQTYSPRFDILEDRYLLSTVSNLDDHGPESLRQAIADTPSGGHDLMDHSAVHVRETSS